VTDEHYSPCSIEAEQALLGAIFLNNEAYHRVALFLRPEHFHEPMHGEIFETVAKIIASGRVANPVTLKSYFTGDLSEDVTWAEYLARLAAEATTVLNAPDYARTIVEHAQRRELVQVAEEIISEAKKPNADIDPKDIIEEAERALFALAETSGESKGVQSFSSAVDGAIEMASEAYKRPGGMAGLATGLSDLDRLMGGLQDSDLVILAARPGMGKTSLATNIAYSVASKFEGEPGADGSVSATSGGRVLFFSLEMSSEQLATRILAEQSKVPSSVIRRGNFHESQFNNIADVASRIKTIPLHIQDLGGQNIGQIVSTARRTKRQKGVDLIVVDYIQLLSGTTKRSGENRVQEITEITTKLKGLAKELDVPVLALSQLSRQVESRENKRPLLADLRDSGSIEQDADVVLFIYRESYYLENSEPKEGSEKYLKWQADMEEAHGKAEIIISKQRHGSTGIVHVHFDSALTRFSNLARNKYSPTSGGLTF